jgi:putative transposase
MDLEDAGASVTFVLHRDASFAAAFDAVFRAAGARVVRSATHAPRMNAFAERFVLTARDRGHRPDAHLRRTASPDGPGPYETHYNGRRPHRSRQLRPPRPDHPVADLSIGRIKRRPVLGGLINQYERAA